MGLSIDKERFSAAERDAFGERLRDSLTALRQVLARPGFGQGERSLGAEVELTLVDRAGRALPLNRAVLAKSLDERLQLELDRFNLEYNLSPAAMRGRPFSALERELTTALSRIEPFARQHDGQLMMIGILPTLTEPDLGRAAMTDLPRYRALSHAIRELRGGTAVIDIEGPEPLSVRIDDVTMEGAATSLQVHLRVEPAEFARVYNAAQLVTAPILAAAANSPLFLGHKLWAETRVALFKQAVDARAADGRDWQAPPRVSFGRGWVREGAYELFAENVHLFPPLLPCMSAEAPLASLRPGESPQLLELRLHHGTVWRWNRAVYDPADGGHLRIELRALPSGPTPLDCVANAAFLVGATLGLANVVDSLLPAMPFDYVGRNFYRAAEHGLAAELVWPDLHQTPSLRPIDARALCLQLLPVAAEGLQSAGVDVGESERLLSIIQDRVQSQQTGARWQLRSLEQLERAGAERSEALAAMTCRYLGAARSLQPVHTWSLQP